MTDSPPPPASTCIVVPAYNEAARLDVPELERFLADPGEVRFVLVNDGSTDGTLGLLKKLESTWGCRVSVLDLERNQGKAEAVRRGVLLAASDPAVRFVGFWDADWATPLDAIAHFVDCMVKRPEMDMVVGARVALLGRQIDRKPHRHYLGRVTATFASWVLGLPVYDTQCGAKLIRVSDQTTSLFEQRFQSGWVFDVELIARYLQTFGRKNGIYELPLDKWTDVGESKVRPIDFVRSFGHMAKIYRHYRLPRRYHRLIDWVTAPFSRYASAGALGTVAHYVVLPLSVEVAGLLPWVGALLGASAGAFVNYVLNYHFVFASDRPHRVVLPRFLAVALLGVSLNTLVVRLGTDHVHYLIAQVGATLLVLGVGFLLNKLWTFRD